MVSGWILARRNKIVSRHPEKTCLTAMADPKTILANWKLTWFEMLLTRYTEKIVCEPEEIWELSPLAHPPMNRITGFKIFSRELEVLFELINNRLCLSMKMRSKILLRWVWGCGYGTWYRCLGCEINYLRWCRMLIGIMRLVVSVQIFLWKLEIFSKLQIVFVVELHAFIGDPWIEHWKTPVTQLI